jgi:uncharacterized protein (TIGR02246 family)
LIDEDLIMNSAAETNELLKIEHRFWNAMQTKDAGVAQEMTDDGCIVVGAQGVSAIDAETMGKLTTEGKWQLDDYSFDEKNAQVRMLSDDVAIVAYKVSERVVVDGKELPIEANDSSVWVRRDGKWLCALHTESLSGDPYGRDKKAPVKAD